MGEPKGQSNGARDLGRDWDLPEPILLTLGGSKSSLPILFISQTLGDLWTGKASDRFGFSPERRNCASGVQVLLSSAW